MVSCHDGVKRLVVRIGGDPLHVFLVGAILIDTSPLASRQVVEECMKQGIILRDCASFRGMGDRYVRITIGTQEQNERLIRTLKKVL